MDEVLSDDEVRAIFREYLTDEATDVLMRSHRRVPVPRAKEDRFRAAICVLWEVWRRVLN